MVNVAHDSDDGRPRLHVCGVIWLAQEGILHILRRCAERLVPELRNHQLGSVGIDGFVDCGRQGPA